jgi:hypothetical protein
MHKHRPVPTLSWSGWYGLGVTTNMMETHTRSERCEDMPFIHGEVNIVGQQCLARCRHWLATNSTRLLLAFGRSIRKVADAGNERL